MRNQLFEPLREWVYKTRRSNGSKKPSSLFSVEGARALRSGDRRYAAASGEIKKVPEPLSSIGSIRSPEASWSYIKQLTEPLSKDGEFISTRPIQTMAKNKDYIAVDIAKDSLQVQAPDYACALPYDQTGLEKLHTIIQKQVSGTILVCEATGGYERQLICFLRQNDLPVVLLNPARVRDFARSEGLKAKTDPLDAKMLLRYANQRQPKPRSAPICPDREELAALMDRRSHLTEMLAREKCRLQNTEAVLQPEIERMIAFIEKELKTLERRITEKIRSNQTLKAHAEIIQSVDGVGPVTAWAICAYLREITEVNRAQLAALAGLAPYNQDSGKMKGRRRIQGGRQKVRGPLYMAATCAAVHNQHIKEYMNRLSYEKGKPYKCALTGAMRKMLIHIQSLLKNYENQLA